MQARTLGADLALLGSQSPRDPVGTKVVTFFEGRQAPSSISRSTLMSESRVRVVGCGIFPQANWHSQECETSALAAMAGQNPLRFSSAERARSVRSFIESIPVHVDVPAQDSKTSLNPHVRKYCPIASDALQHRLMPSLRPKQPSMSHVLAENLRRHMERKHLTQETLAKLAGVAQTTVSLYLRPDERRPTKSGKIASPKLSEVESLAIALGVPAWQLLCRMEDGEHELFQAFQAFLVNRNSTVS